MLTAQFKKARRLVAAGGKGRDRGGAELAARARQQLSFLADAHPVLEELRTLDLDRMTPLEALTLLHTLREKLDQGGKP